MVGISSVQEVKISIAISTGRSTIVIAGVVIRDMESSESVGNDMGKVIVNGQREEAWEIVSRLSDPTYLGYMRWQRTDLGALGHHTESLTTSVHLPSSREGNHAEHLQS